jgi:hypothetical protein
MKNFNIGNIPGGLAFARGEVSSLGDGDLSELGEYDYCVYWYTYADWEGSGEIIVKQNGGFYLASLGHCSCYGPLDSYQTDGKNKTRYNTIDELAAACSKEYRSQLQTLIDSARMLEKNMPKWGKQ